MGIASNGGADFRATLADGTTVDVSIGSSQSVGDVIKAINAAGGTKLKATLNTTNNATPNIVARKIASPVLPVGDKY